MRLALPLGGQLVPVHHLIADDRGTRIALIAELGEETREPGRSLGRTVGTCREPADALPGRIEGFIQTVEQDGLQGRYAMAHLASRDGIAVELGGSRQDGAGGGEIECSLMDLPSVRRPDDYQGTSVGSTCWDAFGAEVSPRT